MKIRELRPSVYRVPTDRPEADGTLEWDSTTVVVVEAVAESGLTGLGLSYGASATGQVVEKLLAPIAVDSEVDATGATWTAMVRAVRNAGRPGIAANAISAVDIALWDLRAKLAEQPLYKLIGARWKAIPVYGSGGFTSYTEAELGEQLAGWVEAGMTMVKMKIGSGAEIDIQRVRAARQAIGSGPELFVDANGSYTAKQAIRLASALAEQGVTYFEEPVSSDRPGELARVRRSIPLDVAAGEYGYDPWYFRTLLEAGAVDILQADATRCLGITGFLEAAALAHAFGVPFSAHTAPAIHLHAACAAPAIAHIEYFHDHVRIERLLFDGAAQAEAGLLRPDPSRPGLGLELKRTDAQRWLAA